MTHEDTFTNVQELASEYNSSNYQASTVKPLQCSNSKQADNDLLAVQSCAYNTY